MTPLQVGTRKAAELLDIDYDTFRETTLPELVQHYGLRPIEYPHVRGKRYLVADLMAAAEAKAMEVTPQPIQLRRRTS